MNRSKIALIVALVVLAVGYVIWNGVTQPKIAPLTPEPIPTASSPAPDLLVYLIKRWPTIFEASLPIRPIYTVAARDLPKYMAWNLPTAVQFIGNGITLVRIEDDTSVYTVVLRLNADRFTVAEIFKGVGSFSAAAWQTLVTKYGAGTYPITTYTTSLIREGRVVAFDQLTLVPENVFDTNYWNGN